jgi:hypothetical protein
MPIQNHLRIICLWNQTLTLRIKHSAQKMGQKNASSAERARCGATGGSKRVLSLDNNTKMVENKRRGRVERGKQKERLSGVCFYLIKVRARV